MLILSPILDQPTLPYSRSFNPIPQNLGVIGDHFDVLMADLLEPLISGIGLRNISDHRAD